MKSSPQKMRHHTQTERQPVDCCSWLYGDQRKGERWGFNPRAHHGNFVRVYILLGGYNYGNGLGQFALFVASILWLFFLFVFLFGPTSGLPDLGLLMLMSILLCSTSSIGYVMAELNNAAVLQKISFGGRAQELEALPCGCQAPFCENYL
jgi:hypothetical protein